MSLDYRPEQFWYKIYNNIQLTKEDLLYLKERCVHTTNGLNYKLYPNCIGNTVWTHEAFLIMQNAEEEIIMEMSENLAREIDEEIIKQLIEEGYRDFVPSKEKPPMAAVGAITT